MSEDKDNGVTEGRRAEIDENGAVIAQPEAQAEEPQAVDAEDLAGDFSGMPPVDVYSLIRSFIGILGSQSWQWLGLLKNPSTGQLEPDLQQARIAIDTISALVGQLEGRMTSAEQREFQGMLSDLRMNFVQQSAKERTS